jgi:prepilin-type N-terminal cleavage/methylation domain-containing protein
MKLPLSHHRSAIGSRSPARAAFTLIELLTVIAIIGILAAILIPTISKVRSVARSANCKSNLRQIGQQLILYGNDNKLTLPKDRFNQQGSYTNGNIGTQTAGGQPRVTSRNGVLAFHLYPYAAKVDPNLLGTASLAPTHPNFICPSLVLPAALTAEQSLSYSLSTQQFTNPGSPYPTYSVRVFNHTVAPFNSGGLIEKNYPLPLSKLWAVSDTDAKMPPAGGWNVNVMASVPNHGAYRNRVYLDGSVRSVDASKCSEMPWENL